MSLFSSTKLSLSNTNGREILSIANYKGEELNNTNLSSGIYYIKIKSGNNTQVKKLIVK